MATNHQLSKLLKGREIETVRQRDTELDIDFTDGSTLSVKLAESTKPITLVDSDEDPEYP